MSQIEKFNPNEGVRIESEEDIRPESIAIATSTFYPKYGEEDPKSVDNVRGNLALNSFTEAKEAGYVLVVVDGGSSLKWKEELEAMRDQIL